MATSGSFPPSVIPAELHITGTVKAAGEIQLDGQVDGDVSAGSVVLGERATVNGGVTADTMLIRGRVQGELRGRNMHLTATARIEGEVTYLGLTIENGAYIDGKCRREDDPLKDVTLTAEPVLA